MSFPGWIPRWFMRLLDIAFGGETRPGVRCDCGADFTFTPDTTEEEIRERLETHNRYFHPERLTGTE